MAGPDEESDKILGIVAELSQNNVKKDVLETEIISRSGLSITLAREYLNKLEWRRLVKEGQPRPPHDDFRLWSITEEGLSAVRESSTS